jgi:hypothetical protein
MNAIVKKAYFNESKMRIRNVINHYLEAKCDSTKNRNDRLHKSLAFDTRCADVTLLAYIFFLSNATNADLHELYATNAKQHELQDK